jgi:predicted permease
MQAFGFCMQLLVMMGAGLVAGRVGIADEPFTKQFSALLVNLLIPCMAVSVMIRRYSAEALAGGMAMMGSCLLVLLTGMLLAILVRLLRRRRDDAAAVLIPCVMFMNANFIGFPVIQALYGDGALVYANFFMVPYRLVFYTLMPMLFRGVSGDSPRSLLRSVLRGANNPGIYAAVGGLVIATLGIPVPETLLSAVSCLGDTALPLGMMACGMYVSRVPFRKAVLNPSCMLAVFCRNLLVPAAVWTVLRLLGAGGMILRLSVIFAALPIPSMAALFAKQNGRNGELAASMVFSSTALCIVTLPLWGELLARFT